MKLKCFDTTVAGIVSAKPYIRLNAKTGLMGLNASLVRNLKITAGDRISFYQDESSPKDWYLAKSAEGFLVRSKDDSAFVNNAHTAKSIIESLQKVLGGVTKVGFRVSEEPVQDGDITLYAIITINPINPK